MPKSNNFTDTLHLMLDMGVLVFKVFKFTVFFNNNFLLDIDITMRYNLGFEKDT